MRRMKFKHYFCALYDHIRFQYIIRKGVLFVEPAFASCRAPLTIYFSAAPCCPSDFYCALARARDCLLLPLLSLPSLPSLLLLLWALQQQKLALQIALLNAYAPLQVAVRHVSFLKVGGAPGNPIAEDGPCAPMMSTQISAPLNFLSRCDLHQTRRPTLGPAQAPGEPQQPFEHPRSVASAFLWR